MGSLLQKRDYYVSVTLEEQVYVLGGYGSSSPYTTTEILLGDSTTWQQGPPLPIEMHNGPCAVPISATSFLVFYGREIREFDASIAGPTSSQGWAKKGRWPELETSRFYWAGCAKVGGNKVIIAGGYERPSTLHTAEILDLTSRTISEEGKMSTPRFWFHIITISYNGDFTTLALAGCVDDFRDDDRKSLNTVEEWKPETEGWSTMETQLKVKRGSFGLVAVPRSLICPSP